uniref:C2H2-type domain-containing protein n=1 Tax=Anopheles funestus TaxID=62324 RepID=A0A2C9GWT1_ANOFN
MDVGSKKRKNSLSPKEGVKTPKKVRFSLGEDTEKQAVSEPILKKDAVAAAAAAAVASPSSPAAASDNDNSLSELHETVIAWLRKNSTNTKVSLHAYLRECDNAEYQEEEVDTAAIETPIRIALGDYTDNMKRRSYKFECEWGKCQFMTGTDRKYFLHVESHAETTVGEEDGSYTCKWDLCDFNTADGDDFIGHVHYHAYHTKLKVHGASIHMLMRLPSCTNDSRARNNISNRPHVFRCEWANCDERFNKAMDFFHHTKYHMMDMFVPGKKSTRKPVKCQWSLCKKSFTCMDAAKKHIRTHSTEREIACYNCGTMLWARVKYIDHCTRQLGMAHRKYKCPQCDRTYATKPLLHNHIENHDKSHECALCPMKYQCARKLAQHMLRRHMKLRNFKCQQCDYATFTQYELTKHLAKHDETKIFRCEEFGCNVAYKSEVSIKKHIGWHYNLPVPVYACHLCKFSHKLSIRVSKHLRFTHNIGPPPGFCNNRYKMDSDGVLRLHSYVTQKQKAATTTTTEEAAVLPSDDGCDVTVNGESAENANTDLSKHRKRGTTERNKKANKADTYAPIKGIPQIESFKSIGLGEFAVELKMEPEPEMEQQSTSDSDVAAAPANPKDVKNFMVMKRYLKKEKS